MPVPILLAVIPLAVALALPAPAEPSHAGASAARAPTTERQWLGPDGKPVPLKTNEEVEEFLRTAEVKSLREISRGVAGSQKALLEKDGIAMHAVFRTIAVHEFKRQIAGRPVFFFRDNYIHEPAAYALSERLGLEMVPPAVARTVRGRDGSLQIWLEGMSVVEDLVKKGLKSPDRRRFLLQFYQLRVFDNLINNLDRNQGNILVDSQWRLWLIDHTRAFVRDRKLQTPEMVHRIERGFWEKLRTLSDRELEATIEPYLPGPERAALLERRRLLVELIQGKIDRIGEKDVLFDRAELEP